jgi:hypothetical protein
MNKETEYRAIAGLIVIIPTILIIYLLLTYA